MTILIWQWITKPVINDYILRRVKVVSFMTKQQMKKLIDKARKECRKKQMKIKMLEYQINFGKFSIDLYFSIN